MKKSTKALKLNEVGEDFEDVKKTLKGYMKVS